MSCIFCEIANKNIPSNLIYEDDTIMVIMDNKPICDGHVMIIPKKHYETVFDAPTEVLNHMYEIANMLTPILMHSTQEDGMTISINYGSKQAIKHLHMHLLPNFEKSASLVVEDVYKIIMGNLDEKKN